jgi:hypothetical protein
MVEINSSSNEAARCRLNILLALMFACEFAQNKFLGQAEDDVETHAGPEICEYQPSAAI